MAITVTKLADKLPIITLPTKLANGDTATPWSKDPYLTDNAIWDNYQATILRNNGRIFNTGLGRQQFLGQTYTDSQAFIKAYFEIRRINCWIDIVNGGNNESRYDGGIITSPGAFIMTGYYGSINGSHSWEIPTSYYIYDSRFNSAAFGNLPVLASIGNEAWCTADTLGGTVKEQNGNISLDMSAGASSSLLWKSPWAKSALCNVEIDILFIPPGGQLVIQTGTGGVALAITEPGTYKTQVTMGATNDLCILPGNTVQGKALITRMMAKQATQPWVTDGKIEIQVDCLWEADATYFDRILNPTTAIASASFERHNLAGWNQPNVPQLGYGQAPPPSGQWRVGDTVYNNCAIAGSVSGWRCTAAGNPGVWQPLASL